MLGCDRLFANRRNIIYDLIEQKGEVSLKELEALFPDISSMTIRRDLDALENENKIVKIKGGAKSISHLSRSMLFKNVEDDYGNRETLNTEAKRIIAQKALPYAVSDRSIFIDAGSTTMQLASKLPDERFFIVTSGINLSMELAANKHITVNLTGGQLSRSNLCVAGAGAIEHLKNINIDVAFIGASCFSPEGGFSNGDYNECELKKYVVSKAKQTIVLMDSSKLGKNMPYTFCYPENVDLLIMEKAPDEELQKISKQTGMKII